MDLNQDYLTEQIITYLGNKRKLLASIKDVIETLAEQDQDLAQKLNTNTAVSYDAFSGSGIVSRLLRTLGFINHANDLETYAYPINRAFLELTSANVEPTFAPVVAWLEAKITFKSTKTTSYDKVIDLLNNINMSSTPYFSKHYAPANTNAPDFENERLFYTQENARLLDQWSSIIHDQFMDKHPLAKCVLAASILYVMGKQINTSGVMKGFHNGWGGRGGAALGRIMGKMVLSCVPINDSITGHAWTGDAADTLDNIPTIDVVYADPPYNQHQYGANYHLLTTFWNNDKYDPGPVVKGSRAGIRSTHNRSSYAQAKEAEKTFNAFVQKLGTKSKYLIVSYNNEGLISPAEMINILSQNHKNTVDVVTIKHDKFKGGKSTQTSNAVVEYLFITKFNVLQTKISLKNILEKTIAATKHTTYEDTYVDPVALKELFNVTVTSKGWLVSNEYGWSAFVGKDRRVSAVSKQPISEKEQELLKNSTLTKEELLNIYIVEKRWSNAINTLRSFKLKRDLDIFQRNARIIHEQLKLENNKYLLKLELLYKTIMKVDITE